MARHLHNELERLEKSLLSLSGYVEENFHQALRCIRQRDMELAEQVIANDADIDRMEVELEEDCLKTLALHQPVANDLRFVIAILKINNDLERVGDLAANIAKRVHYLARHLPITLPDDLHTLADWVWNQLRQSINAFVEQDVEAARRLCNGTDRETDRLQRIVLADLVRQMHKTPERLDCFLQLMWIARALERIGDHAENIAEDVVYSSEGEIIRHRCKKIFDPSEGQ